MDRLRSPNILNRALPAVLGGVLLTASGCQTLESVTQEVYAACPRSTKAELIGQQTTKHGKDTVTFSGRIVCATAASHIPPLRTSAGPFHGETNKLVVSGTSDISQTPHLRIDPSGNVHTVEYSAVDDVHLSSVTYQPPLQ